MQVGIHLCNYVQFEVSNSNIFGFYLLIIMVVKISLNGKT